MDIQISPGGVKYRAAYAANKWGLTFFQSGLQESPVEQYYSTEGTGGTDGTG